MTGHLLYSILALIFSSVCGFIFIPLIMNFCERHQLYDIPNTRKIHKNAIPRLGGISFLPSMLLAFLFVLFLMNEKANYEKISMSIWSIYFLISLLLIYCIGLIDDFIGLGALPKFFVQIIAASFLPAAGLYINNLHGLFGIYDIPNWIGFPLTVFLIVYINNAINLIDGIDGLSAGISIIALIGFLFCSLKESMWLYAILISGLIGVLIPFMYFNLFGDATKNKKIFMGDSGSLTLGFIMGFLIVKFSMDNPFVLPFTSNSHILAITLLIVPIFDTARVILVRIKHRRNIFQSDKNHIHHKLLRAGLSQHRTLVTILCISLFYISLNMTLCGFIDITIIFIIDILLWVVTNYYINKVIISLGEKPFYYEKNV